MSLIPCYNRGCGKDFDPENNTEDSCRYHPGVPYFHDAYKGWSCCKKKSVDFTEFLNIRSCDISCELSKHSNAKPPEPEKPKQDVVVEEPKPMPSRVVNSSLERVDFNSPLTAIQPTVASALKQTIDNIGPSTAAQNEVADSRYDWHQTAANVVIAIYAKSCQYAESYVKVNPIRLDVRLVFPLENYADFTLNLELRGVIDVQKTKVQFLGTKVEISLTKAEPGSWAKLDFPRAIKTATAPQVTKIVENKADSDSDVDLDDVEAMNAVTIKDF